VDLRLTSHFDPEVPVSELLGLAICSLMRAKMASLGAKLIDGFGADRVVKAMRSRL
jgi:hypothetical protein